MWSTLILLFLFSTRVVLSKHNITRPCPCFLISFIYISKLMRVRGITATSTAFKASKISRSFLIYFHFILFNLLIKFIRGPCSFSRDSIHRRKNDKEIGGLPCHLGWLVGSKFCCYCCSYVHDDKSSRPKEIDSRDGFPAGESVVRVYTLGIRVNVCSACIFSLSHSHNHSHSLYSGISCMAPSRWEWIARLSSE